MGLILQYFNWEHKPNKHRLCNNNHIGCASPDLQAKTRESLQQQTNIMQARGVEQSFKPIDMYYDTKNDMVYVWGTKSTRLINVPDKTESSKWTFEWVLGMKKDDHA
jgi:hypothetical protein